MKKIKLIIIATLALATSCVSKKDHEALQNKYKNAAEALGMYESKLQACNTDKSKLEVEKSSLNNQVNSLEKNVKSLQDALLICNQSQQQGNANIDKLIGEIGASNQYIQKLIASNNRKDSLNNALSTKLRRSLDNTQDENIDIQVKKGVVFISLSDKMLFQSGSYKVNSTASIILGKIAKIVNDYKDYDILIEGHTDNIPVSKTCIEDNWDLSALRATSIARELESKFYVDPSRITAGGRSQFVPKDTNETPLGRAANRRTEIIILPKLDEFMKLLDLQKENQSL